MKAEIIYFSATGTTRTLVKAISQGLSSEVYFTDITLPANRKSYQSVESDLVIIAVPIYGERIPKFLCDFLKQIEGNTKPLAVVSVYGNVGFGISLQQFEDFAAKNHFYLIAAAALIGQHTYATETVPVAYGRPDEYDLEQARIFGGKLRKKFDTENFTPIMLPKPALPKFIAEFPDAGTRFLIRQPRVNKSVCNACGACARKCPAGAIDHETLKINEQQCLRCYACVKTCPKSARTSEFRLPIFESAFSHIGRKRKRNQIYL